MTPAHARIVPRLNTLCQLLRGRMKAVIATQSPTAVLSPGLRRAIKLIENWQQKSAPVRRKGNRRTRDAQYQRYHAVISTFW